MAERFITKGTEAVTVQIEVDMMPGEGLTLAQLAEEGFRMISGLSDPFVTLYILRPGEQRIKVDVDLQNLEPGQS